MGPEDVRAQLERILASPILASSARLSRFLRFVVDATQAGQSDSLKEYSIGVEVFERGVDFDPRVDNVVRIHAGKLRSKLVEYYASTGANDPVIITIPKGGYAPEIRPKEPPAAPASRTDPRSRIAVLPFVNMSADPENEYFSDGLTEELINRLARNPSLQVVARTSAFQFKGQNEDLREVGAKLNAGTVLEGSVRRAGGQLRVTAQLIDVQTGYHLFSRTYQREFKGLFELQDELAQAVADEIAPADPPVNPAKTRTPDLDAYGAYLRGVFAMANNFSDLSRCLECFQEALSRDPGYAPAWAGLSQGYFMLAWFYRASPEQMLPLSRAAALKALELDPDSALGLHCMGVVECASEWRWAPAEGKFRKGLALQPTVSIGYVNYSYFCLLPQCREKEACAVIEQGLSLDPFNPLLQAVAIYVYARAGHFDDAFRQYALARSVGPKYAPIRASMGAAYEWNGDLEEAIATYREGCNLAQNALYPLSCLGHALALAGQTEEAREILYRLETSGLRPAADIARIYSGLRDAEQTLRWLNIAAETRCLYLLRATGDPRFDWLLPDARYQRIVRAMGLPLRH